MSNSKPVILTDGGGDYERSKIINGWKADGTFYRRIVTREGEIVIEKGVDGRYVPDHRRGKA